MKNITFKHVVIGLLATAGLATAGCSDEQLSFGAGAVVGAIVADRDGGYHREYRPPRHRGYHRYAIETSENGGTMSNEMATAAHFQIPVDSGSIVWKALAAAQQKDYSALADLGVTREDITAMAMGENPSASTLKNLSEKLGLTLGETHSVIQQIKMDLAQAQ